MKEKITAWVARDRANRVYLFAHEKPIKISNCIWGYGDTPLDDERANTNSIRLNMNKFPQVKWEDKEPTKVELTIKICE